MTLVEVMLAASIFGMVMAAATTWMLSMLDICGMSTGVALVSRDMRSLTAAMTDEGRNANSFIIYNSFTDRTRVSSISSGGDYLVLNISDAAGDTERTVGYYRDAGANNEGPVRKHDSAAGGPAAGTLPSTSTVQAWPEVVELSRGLSGTEQKLFCNYGSQSFMVGGQIIQKGARKQGTWENRATSTYNFTITPRS